jgi:hypothetical protein
VLLKPEVLGSIPSTKTKNKTKPKKSRAPVAHFCNPSYSRGRDQKDRGSKPAEANSYAPSYLEKNPSQKRAGGVTEGVGPEFKPQYRKKKRKKERKGRKERRKRKRRKEEEKKKSELSSPVLQTQSRPEPKQNNTRADFSQRVLEDTPGTSEKSLAPPQV